eukprot:gene8454-25141_t
MDKKKVTVKGSSVKHLELPKDKPMTKADTLEKKKQDKDFTLHPGKSDLSALGLGAIGLG